eukprot:6464094-Amphidinium_carterae.1
MNNRTANRKTNAFTRLALQRVCFWRILSGFGRAELSQRPPAPPLYLSCDASLALGGGLGRENLRLAVSSPASMQRCLSCLWSSVYRTC